MQKIVNCPICNQKLELQKTESQVYYFCKSCNLGGKGKTEEEAKKKLVETSQKINTALTIPQNPKQVPTWAEQNIRALIESSAQFIDKPETRRMIQKNVNYIATADFKKAWDTDEGRISIVEAFTEALYYGCMLGEMGDIVPFGNVVEFIPGMATFEFALTTGKAAPLSDVRVECIYENDQYEASRDNGNFSFKFTKLGLPRGEIIGIVVQAFDIENKKNIGEMYDEKRLMDKAAQHSISYKYYLRDIQALRKAQSEGKDFIEKKPGWKLYENDITNPYANADKPEMLKKVAGKSYFRPWMKIRNAKAVVEENRQSGNIKDIDDIYEKTINESVEAMKDNIKDAEVIQEPEEKKESGQTQNVQEDFESKDLFGEG